MKGIMELSYKTDTYTYTATQAIHSYYITDGHAAGTGYCQVWDARNKSEIQSINNTAGEVSLWGGLPRLPPPKLKAGYMLC